jgi:type II secretion system protein G
MNLVFISRALANLAAVALFLALASPGFAEEKKVAPTTGPATRPTTRPAVPRFDPKVEFTRSAIQNISVAIEQYEIDNAQYPTTSQGLKALLEKPAGVTTWRGPYVRRLINDPWDHPFVYKSPGVHNPTAYDLSSYGPDGRESKDDIDNWSER